MSDAKDAERDLQQLHFRTLSQEHAVVASITRVPPPRRSFGRPLVVLTAVVVVLAIGLVAVGIVSYRIAEENARAGLTARLWDRAFAITSVARGLGPEDGDALKQVLARQPFEGGHLKFVDDGGRVVASSRAEEIGRVISPPPPFEGRGPAGPAVQNVGGAEPGIEVWVPVPPQPFPRRGTPPIQPLPSMRAKRDGPPDWIASLDEPPPPPPGEPGPPPPSWNASPPPWAAGPRPAGEHGPPRLRLCVGMPLSRGLVGVTTALTQLIVSITGAAVLLLLAILTIRATRRAATLAVESERRQRLASLGQLAAVVAHEIRTPLATVRGYAQLLSERVAEKDEQIQGPTAKIVRETDRLGQLAEDLLSYARPAPPRFGPVDVARVVKDAAERVAQSAAARKVRLLCDAGEAVTAWADGQRLGQAFDNLLSNAIQVSPEGETAVIRVLAARGRVTVEVADRGPGIPVEHRERVFEPFFTTRLGGTGLGLAVVRRIADEHGGGIEFSDRPGGGTLFRMTLPERAIAPV